MNSSSKFTEAWDNARSRLSASADPADLSDFLNILINAISDVLQKFLKKGFNISEPQALIVHTITKYLVIIALAVLVIFIIRFFVKNISFKIKPSDKKSTDALISEFNAAFSSGDYSRASRILVTIVSQSTRKFCSTFSELFRIKKSPEHEELVREYGSIIHKGIQARRKTLEATIDQSVKTVPSLLKKKGFLQ